MENLETRIKKDIKTTLPTKNQVRLDTLRNILSEIVVFQKNIGISKTITPENEMAILKKLAKQRKESISMFSPAGRQDLVDKETAQLLIINEYLPAEKTEDEIQLIINNEIENLKSTLQEEVSNKHFGKIMQAVMKTLAGSGDGTIVSNLIKKTLNLQS